MTDSIITEAAVEAALDEFVDKGQWLERDRVRPRARAALTAALPHITDPRLAAAQARIAELEEALRPFRDFARKYIEAFPTGDDDESPFVEVCGHPLNFVPFRRARDVLERKA